MFRLLKRLFFTLVIATVAGGLAYSFTDSFAQRWRQFVIAKFEERNVHVDFASLGLSLRDGVVARDVRIYNDAAHQQMLMSMDRLNLDLDYGRLMKKEFFVEGGELTDAHVALPLDPNDPKQGTLDLRNFSARVYLMDDRLDIRRAEGELAGVRLTITGSLLLPPSGPHKARTGDKSKLKAGLASLHFLPEQRSSVQKGLAWLQRFTFERKPEIAFEINGNLDDPDGLSARLQFNASGVRYEGYVCQELSASAEYHNRMLDVRRVTLKDKIGTFEASAVWPMDAEDVQFHINTTADLPGLARAFFQTDDLKEVVFYETSPPSLTLEGRWFISGPKAGPKRPVEALGKIRFGRFTTRGEIFDGLTASFGVSPTGYYIRDGMLRHKTGTLSVNAMLQAVEGFRYRAVMKMDPHAFLSFVGSEPTRELIKRFEFQDGSTVFLQLEGSGTDASLATCRNTGHLNLRDFKFRGVEFNEWSGDLEFFNRKQVFHDITMTPASGQAEAAEVVIDNEARTVSLKGVKAKLDPVMLLSCFARPQAEFIQRYQLTADTETEMDGLVGMQDPTLNNFNVRFTTPSGSGNYNLWERDYHVTAPSGSLAFKASKLDYDIKGRVFGGPMHAKGSVDLGRKSPRYDLDFSAAEFRHRVMGKDLPLENVTAVVQSKGGRSPFEIKGRTLDGKLSLTGEFLDGAKDAYQGELELSGLSCKRFASIYAPGNETVGDITGHFQFTGEPGDWKALRGKGVIIILNSNLYAVPILGPLTPLLGSVLPSQIKDYNLAKEANCNFTVADGKIVTQDFEADTTAFKLVASGTIDFIKDDIDFTAQARVRGLPGLVLRPVSELLEYKAEGSLTKPHWRPRFLSLPDEKEKKSEPDTKPERKPLFDRKLPTLINPLRKN